MALLTWDDQFTVGFQSMDAQHKLLFESVNELHRAWTKGKRETSPNHFCGISWPPPRPFFGGRANAGQGGLSGPDAATIFASEPYEKSGTICRPFSPRRKCD